MTTNNIESFLKSSLMAYSTLFLDPHGKIMFDTVLAKTSPFDLSNPSLFLETNKSQGEDLVRHIKKHSAKKSVSIEPLDEELSVFVDTELLSEDLEGTKVTLHDPEDNSDEPAGYISFVDPRSTILGTRIYTYTDGFDSDENIEIVEESNYNMKRILHGIPEGEAIQGLTPRQANFHLFNSICFDKKCYIGQEQVLEMYNGKGSRSRIQPFVVKTNQDEEVYNKNYDRNLAGESILDKAGNKVGKILENVNNIGLVLVNTGKIQTLEIVTQSEENVIVLEGHLTNDSQ